jgi:hypothetical protein
MKLMDGAHVVEVVPDGLGEAERFCPRPGSHSGDLRAAPARQASSAAQSTPPAERPGNLGDRHAGSLLTAKQNVKDEIRERR